MENVVRMGEEGLENVVPMGDEAVAGPVVRVGVVEIRTLVEAAMVMRRVMFSGDGPGRRSRCL